MMGVTLLKGEAVDQLARVALVFETDVAVV